MASLFLSDVGFYVLVLVVAGLVSSISLLLLLLFLLLRQLAGQAHTQKYKNAQLHKIS